MFGKIAQDKKGGFLLEQAILRSINLKTVTISAIFVLVQYGVTFFQRNGFSFSSVAKPIPKNSIMQDRDQKGFDM